VRDNFVFIKLFSNLFYDVTVFPPRYYAPYAPPILRRIFPPSPLGTSPFLTSVPPIPPFQRPWLCVCLLPPFSLTNYTLQALVRADDGPVPPLPLCSLATFSPPLMKRGFFSENPQDPLLKPLFFVPETRLFSQTTRFFFLKVALRLLIQDDEFLRKDFADRLLLLTSGVMVSLSFKPPHPVVSLPWDLSTFLPMRGITTIHTLFPPTALSSPPQKSAPILFTPCFTKSRFL